MNIPRLLRLLALILHLNIWRFYFLCIILWFSFLFHLLYDLFAVKSFLNSCQKCPIKLTNVLLFSDRNWIPEIINNRIKNPRGVSVFLVWFCQIGKKLLQFEDELLWCFDPFFNLFIYTGSLIFWIFLFVLTGLLRLRVILSILEIQDCSD
jgi:hypothetical protein